MTEPMHLTGVDAATGETAEYWIADGRLVDAAVSGAREITGFLLPGFADLHCHIGYSATGAVSLDVAEQQALANLRAGTLLIRDCGSPVDTRPLLGRHDLPQLIRAGWHIGRPKRYIRYLSIDVEDPAELPAEVARQCSYGGGWIKLVGDWIDRDIGDLAPLWPREVLAEAIAVAHDRGARVTAHCFAEDCLPDLLDAGIDCIEHGTGLTDDTIAQMARQGTHLVPTLINIDNFPQFIEAATRFPAYAKHMQDLFDRHVDTLGAAREAGVSIHAGTDAGGFVAHGRIADEVAALTRVGFSPREALYAASYAAHDFLRVPTGSVGDVADFVVYATDPADDMSVLKSPAAVIRAGRQVS